jgi:hypothetical protein
MSQNRKERMWTLALKLARSGDYGICRQIEKKLENQGFSAARRWLDAGEHDRLDRLCIEARMPKSEKRLTDEQQKAKALSRWENEGGQSQTPKLPRNLNQPDPPGA